MNQRSTLNVYDAVLNSERNTYEHLWYRMFFEANSPANGNEYINTWFSYNRQIISAFFRYHFGLYLNSAYKRSIFQQMIVSFVCNIKIVFCSLKNNGFDKPKFSAYTLSKVNALSGFSENDRIAAKQDEMHNGCARDVHSKTFLNWYRH